MTVSTSPTGRVVVGIDPARTHIRRIDKTEVFGDWKPRITMGALHSYLRRIRDGAKRDYLFEAAAAQEMEHPLLRSPKAEEKRKHRTRGDGRGPMTDVELATDLLLKMLRCPSCNEQLSEEPCAPVHALLQDSPLQHPVLLPLMEQTVTKVRSEGRLCPMCKIPIATGECPHIVTRFGQVWISATRYNEIVEGLIKAKGHIDELNTLHDEYVMAVEIERKRAETHRKRWATEWALEKFSRICTNPRWADLKVGSAGFHLAFEKMLKEDK